MSISPTRDRAIDLLMPPLTTVPASPTIISNTAVSPRDAMGMATFASRAFPQVTADFDRFWHAQAKLGYAQRGPDARVSDPNAFAEMQRYLFNRYNGLTVVRTLHDGERAFDCVPLAQQPGLRDGSVVALPPSVAAASSVATSATLQHCDTGTVPLERIALSDLVLHPSLQDFLRKQPAPTAPSSSATVTPAASGASHYYSSVFFDTGGSPVTGVGADLNVWTPAFPSSQDYMSISQIWLDGTSESGKTQTLEVGWQKRPSYPGWGSTSITFIYSTQDGYTSTGCHNLECGDFVQTASGNYLGTGYGANGYSVQGGTQKMLGVEFQRNTDGNWWLRLNGQWIGYYKAELYSGSLADGGAANVYTAGGEVLANDNTPATPMGSGRFAAAGYRQAAFQANHFYRDTNMNTHALQRLTGVSLQYPACYTLALVGLQYPYQAPAGLGRGTASPEMTTGGFYFGGPGCAR
ncbi:neprosin family prolyl endopeptidase [Xanthomonas sp. 3058]|uniref:neprosin family prolyl endopeptidase n=1 Tax=Xanthomonas sp. 3058 TaxID=3035314 RepID=UPI001798F8B6|nr:neprosin family prolyl endopeptidase [Xanthomonas sp. 3058]MBB5865688.1 hypothetical protein [Xanthomonas sp. 3058]